VEAVRPEKYHGRISGASRTCSSPGCDEPGEFRAPGERRSSFDGPGDYRWFCLDHVRAHNAGYDWFAGMSADEIVEAQHPASGWGSESPTFRATMGIDAAPRWADFADPLEAISVRARGVSARKAGEAASARFSADERRALETLGLGWDADRTALRQRYSELVRRYHPDRNGGDRSRESLLQRVVEAYQLLRRAAAVA
jgi:hypothetical protein